MCEVYIWSGGGFGDREMERGVMTTWIVVLYVTRRIRSGRGDKVDMEIERWMTTTWIVVLYITPRTGLI
jgi:hypothetical protein